MKSYARAARRWVPWICAYTGCRVQEATQLRAEDVVEHDGTMAIRILPSAGTVKSGTGRTVPIHEHIIEQGFLDFVRSVGQGSDQSAEGARDEGPRAFLHLGPQDWR
jgi:hypothetical protein